MTHTYPHVNSENWLKHNGHGHVMPNVQGLLARCGGPSMCGTCKVEEELKRLIDVSRKLYEEQRTSWIEFEKLRTQNDKYFDWGVTRVSALADAATPIVSLGSIQYVKDCDSYMFIPATYQIAICEMREITDKMEFIENNRKVKRAVDAGVIPLEG